jgi:hypothetical protein
MSLLPRASAIRDTAGMIKMAADAGTEEVLGVSMVGNSAGEVIHEAAMGLRFHAKINDFIELLHVYPTRAEAQSGGSNYRAIDEIFSVWCGEPIIVDGGLDGLLSKAAQALEGKRVRPAKSNAPTSSAHRPVTCVLGCEIH